MTWTIKFFRHRGLNFSQLKVAGMTFPLIISVKDRCAYFPHLTWDLCIIFQAICNKEKDPWFPLQILCGNLLFAENHFNFIYFCSPSSPRIVWNTDILAEWKQRYCQEAQLNINGFTKNEGNLRYYQNLSIPDKSFWISTSGSSPYSLLFLLLLWIALHYMEYQYQDCTEQLLRKTLFYASSILLRVSNRDAWPNFLSFNSRPKLILILQWNVLPHLLFSWCSHFLYLKTDQAASKFRLFAQLVFQKYSCSFFKFISPSNLENN